jgi:bifunctional DNA primase/polymerase-like protein/AAA domain-containing protein/primase-like protein
MLNVALDCLRRSWFVFPCVPQDKNPLVKGGFKVASNDEAQIRAWWTKWPSANVAIATGASGLTVFDCDKGLPDLAAYEAWIAAKGLPETYTVRTGRRVSKEDGVTPEFGVQLYFQTDGEAFGDALRSIPWLDGEQSGDIRGSTGYVLAAGSIHPDSKEAYEVLVDAPVAKSVPQYVRTIPPAPKTGTAGGANGAVVDVVGPITASRNVHMISLLGKKRNEGADDDALEAYAHEVNETRMQPPLDESELSRLITNACKFRVQEVAPEVFIGGRIAGALEAANPWAKYHTTEQILNAPPVTFLIDGFLTQDAICVIAAPVAQRKSILALNVVHSLVSGEPLFGRFEVKKRPTRVLYCCPEMGIQSFSARLKSMGLAAYLGKTLFCTTMASDPFELKDITPDELKGAVIVLDTAIRFLKGDESNAAEMSVFAATVFRLIKDGAASVLLLHHSKKGTSEAAELTLDNVMRGSGELGAFVACVWATRLQDGKDEYKTPSYLENVKKRDFDSKPFQVLPVEGSYRLLYDSKGEVVLSKPSRFKRDKDGKEAQALAFIAATRQTSPTMSYVELSRMLQEHGIERSPEWIRKRDKSGTTHRSD